ncbi:acyltransferase [Salmonella enterica]
MKNKLTSLQALRGVAAISVMLFHYRFSLRAGDNSGTTIWDSLFSWGIIGVDVFFVISGFIMFYTTQNYRQGIASTKHFLLNRAIRIVPLYYFGLLIAFLFGGAMSTFHYPSKVQTLISALTFTVNNISVKPHYINDAGMYNIRWTLNYEIYFYIVFAVCLLMKHRILALACWGCIVTFIIPSIAGFAPTISVQGYAFQTPTIAFLTNPLLLEFLIGVFAGYIYIQFKKHILSTKLPIISIIIAFCLLAYIIYGIYSNRIVALNLGSTAIIGFFVLFLTLGESILNPYIPRALIYIGDISFSLYLLHNPIIIAVKKLIGPIGESATRGIFVVIVAMLLSVLISHLTHKYIEISLTRKLKSKLTPAKNQNHTTQVDLAN